MVAAGCKGRRSPFPPQRSGESHVRLDHFGSLWHEVVIRRLGSKRQPAVFVISHALFGAVATLFGDVQTPRQTVPSKFCATLDFSGGLRMAKGNRATASISQAISTRVGAAIATVGIALSLVSAAHAQNVDWQKIDDILGRKPAVTDDVHRYGFPRSDLSVTLDGVAIKPALALGGWVAFKPAHGGVMAMGDLVLLETEINPVMAKMIAAGLEITAIHNHLLRAAPATFYMHVAGHGDPAKIAAAIRDGLAESKTPLTVAPPSSPPPAVDLDTAQLDSIMGVKGQNNGGIYAFTVKRRDPIKENDMLLTPVGPMGVATAINFQPTGAGKAAITGDFVLAAEEVNPVIQALRANGIEVTALHSHMLDEQPRLFFMHFWAHDDAVKLARGLRAALDKTASSKS